MEVKNNLGDSIKNIKEILRSIPNKGVGYGTFSDKNKIHSMFKNLPPISFNYLGQFDNQEGNDWQLSSDFSGLARDPSDEGNNLIDINGLFLNGKLTFKFFAYLNQDMINKLSDSFEYYLMEILNHCINIIDKDDQEYTVSDFNNFELFSIKNNSKRSDCPLFVFLLEMLGQKVIMVIFVGI